MRLWARCGEWAPAMPSDARARPIPMSAWEVRALLDRGKTQARRRVSTGHYTDGLRGYSPTGQLVDYHGNGRSLGLKYAHDERGLWHKRDNPAGRSALVLPCPYGRPGDLLWCQETWKHHSIYAHLKPRDLPRADIFFRADDRYAPSNTPWRPGIHMPRWASRLTLELTDVRVQRVQEISEEDAEAEGMPEPYLGDGDAPFTESPVLVSRRVQFRNLWNDLNARRGHGWNENDWVWALSFTAHRQNVDALIEERRHAA